MNKPNLFRSSEFHMDKEDVLHILIDEMVGVTPVVTLNSDGVGASVPDKPIATDASDITVGGFTANWSFIENAVGYRLDVAEDSGFLTMVAGYGNLDVGFVDEYPIVGLTDGNDYYYKVRAYNDVGTSIDSNIITTITAFGNVMDFDGNIYTYVLIGTQEWMIENLKTTHYADSTPITNLPLAGGWAADATGAYCWYDNLIANKTPYGALYNWHAVHNAHGLAPTGWKIPTKADWQTLVDYVGNDADAAAYLKEVGFVHWTNPNTGALDTYGFRALPGGIRFNMGIFAGINTAGAWWTSVENNALTAWFREMAFTAINTGLDENEKEYGNSVRCMRDL